MDASVLAAGFWPLVCAESERSGTVLTSVYKLYVKIGVGIITRSWLKLRRSSGPTAASVAGWDRTGRSSTEVSAR
eukprot:4122620-Amphidinium_carterae.1